MPQATFISAHPIGAKVTLFLLNDRPDPRLTGVVRGVSFSVSKVTYDVDLDIGGETLRNVDSTFVTSAVA